MDSKLMKPLPKQLMLKDYLLDDLSSCSSSGFRSYPRRQCCTTVRFLLEIELKSKYPPLPPPYKKNAITPVLRPKPAPPSATVSVFHKASAAVINAVKHLQFAGAKSPLSSSSPKQNKKKTMKMIFPRSLSRKLKRSFWKRGGDHKEIYWWTAFNRLDNEELKSPAFSPVVTAITAAGSSSSTSQSKNKSNSWSSGCDFTASSDNSLQTSSGNSEVNSIETEDDAVASSKIEKVVSAKTGDDSPGSTTSSHGSTTNSPLTKKPWLNKEKEQFSPVSTLDCPFADEDEVSSPFQHRLNRMEGTTKKLMKKIKKFECLTELEPLNLEKRIESSESESESPLTNSSRTETEEEEQKGESKALDLVQELKTSMPSYGLKLEAEELLLDFFKERTSSEHYSKDAKELLQVAKDWINGKPIEVLLDWKVQENRMAYIRDIESRGEWKNTESEKKEVVLELEAEVFASLMDELLFDLVSC